MLRRERALHAQADASLGLGYGPQEPLPSVSPSKPMRGRLMDSGVTQPLSHPAHHPRSASPSQQHTSQLPTPSIPSGPGSPQSGAAFWLGPTLPQSQAAASQAAAMRYSNSPR